MSDPFFDDKFGPCAGCGAPLDANQPAWMRSVNLTPDALVFGVAVHEMDPGIELDIAFDWCSADCFGRTLFRAAAQLGWVPRGGAE